MTKYPTKPYLLQIINHFGVDNQSIKLLEELGELQEAHVKFFYGKASEGKENLLHFIEELSDCMVLAKQLAVSEYDIPLGEIAAMQPTKILRTIDIIIKSDKSKDPVQEYNRIRRGND